ncbi:hypothetical protein B4589_004435 [Halolamina sp. CBA1230]|uniref:hypothetical protein n=1 Tax=Halolamina sp. CBA1230 TaxID=1853690 RepID=UPI0009A1BE7E|nr:hypothetical protein [Halolamina sp. CBA1230]QKY19663.1 hypothetical protein B4589_004435 [Halolamina sp. CBA1230]
MNQAKNCAEGTNSPVHDYVADHGRAISKTDLEQASIAGHEVTLSKDVTADERALIENAIQATRPETKACFGNAYSLWEYDTRFKYTEGVAVMADLSLDGINHAWSMLDGTKLVDPTAPLDDYYGVVIEDETISQLSEAVSPAHGIISNHKNRFEFLRERGYVE